MISVHSGALSPYFNAGNNHLESGNVKKYHNEDWLRGQIEVEGLTYKEVGEMCGVTIGAIQYYANKHNITRPGNTKTKANLTNAKILQNRDWLFNEYITLNKSYETIVQENGVGKTTVARWVKRHGLHELKCTTQSGKRFGEGPPVAVKCENCGKGITIKHSKYKECLNRFCGHSCSAKYQLAHTDNNAKLQEAVAEWRTTPEAKAFMREHGARVMSEQTDRETSIERKIREMLTAAGIEFEAEKKMYYWCVDFYIPKYDIVIEAHGDYWHAHPDSFPNPSAMQKRNMRRDKGKRAYMKKCGHSFMEFWERDINADIDGVLFEVLAEINAIKAIA